MKELLIILLAIGLLLIALPFICLAIILILSIDRSPPFFLQERLGQHQRPFTIYKLRTMKNGAITPVGKILRQSGIDELPQLFNIIERKINFVGPRPLMHSDLVRLNWLGSHYAFRWSVKPGLTGLAQLSPICHRKMTLFWDKYYVEHQSVWLDLKIVLGSALIPIIGKQKMKSLLNSRT